MLAFLCIASCNRIEEDTPFYDRTVLIYMAAENSLSQFYYEDIEEIQLAANKIPYNSRLLVYIDDSSLPRILSIEKQEGRRPACTEYKFDSEHDSGSAETLRLVMEWMHAHAPSASYGLVMWSHGTGWTPAKAPAQRAVCQDVKSKSWMEIADIANVLNSFEPLEFIMFDACFMQSIEVAYELRKSTHYIIASPAEIPGPGAPYHRIMAPMFSFPLNAESIIEEYYREYADNKIHVGGTSNDYFGVCLSVVDCSKLEQLAAVTEEINTKHIGQGKSGNTDGVQRYYPLTRPTMPEHYDMNDYMLSQSTDAADHNSWQSAFEEAVPYKRSTPTWYSDYTHSMLPIDTVNYGGISCYIPKTSRTALNENFRSTSWYKASGWQQIGW